MIKKSSLALLSVFALGVAAARAQEILPPRFDFGRYSAMVKKSPFAIATAAAAPAATPDFAKDLYVANAAHSKESDMVTIASIADQNFKKYLTTRVPVEGYGIASIEWSKRVGATKVTISKGGKFATLSFNEALLAQTPREARPVAGQPRPGAPLLSRSVPRQAQTRRSMRQPSKANPNLAPARAPNLPHTPKVALEVTADQQMQQEQQMQRELHEEMQARLQREPAQLIDPQKK